MQENLPNFLRRGRHRGKTADQHGHHETATNNHGGTGAGSTGSIIPETRAASSQ
jgi:hypothetical protein